MTKLKEFYEWLQKEDIDLSETSFEAVEKLYEDRAITYKGNNVLSVSRGTKVKTHLGDILIRTDNSLWPFVDVINGYMWGNQLKTYIFTLVK